MSWGAVAGAAVGVVGSALSDSGGGGGGQTASQSKQPWMPATPWLMNNLASGQRLQSQYEAQPFNAQQQQAYQNQANQGAYMRAAVPNLLRQMQGQQLGFDRANPNARATAFNWDGLMSAAKEGEAARAQQGGLLDMLNSGGAVNSSLTPMAEPPKKQDDGTFLQQDMGYTPTQQRLLDEGRNPWMMGYTQALGGQGSSNGSYGAYRYGDQVQPGTPAYRDMMEFFMRGGNDPLGIAPGGLGIKRMGPYGDANAGTNNGDGVSSSATGSDY